MSAIRLRRTSKDIEVRVDDNSPQCREPVWLQLGDRAANLTCEEADELIAGLQAAVADARGIFAERPAIEPLYDCVHSGCEVKRTKAEGGTVFTVCDKHWDERMAVTPHRNAVGVAVWEVMRKRLPKELQTTDLLNELLNAAEIR